MLTLLIKGYCVNVVSNIKPIYLNKHVRFKGAAKLYFTHYIGAVIVLFNTGLYKSVISAYSFAKLLFWCFLWFSVYSVF